MASLPSDSPEDARTLETLVARAKRGDREAIEDLLEPHLPGLRAFVRLRAGPAIRAKESCSDIVQSVCREVLGALDTFEYRGDASFRSWLYTWAENKIRNRLHYYHAAKRDVAREADVSASKLLACYSSFCSPSHDLMVQDEILRVERAFDDLPPHYREVITLKHVVGLSHAEIGRRMGRSEGATRVLLNRALARLATVLDRASPG